MKEISFALVLIASLAPAQFASVASAGEPVPAPDARDAVIVLLRGTVHYDRTTATIRAAMEQAFDRTDLDGGGISDSDADLADRISRAQTRAQLVQHALKNDLDGDGRLTEAELRQALEPQARRPLRSAAGTVAPTEGQIAETLATLVARGLAADSDGDGVITYSEILAGAKKSMLADRARTRVRQLSIGMEFDADGDGIVARREFLARSDAVIAEFDADGDGVISIAEFTAFTKAAKASIQAFTMWRREVDRLAKLRERAANCHLPQAPTDALFVALGIVQGSALTTVGFAGPPAWVTVADIEIEPGSRPIYLFAIAGEPTILRLSGDIGRIARMVTPDGMIGIVGMPEARISRVGKDTCIKPFWSERTQPNPQVETLAAAAQRPVDATVATHTAGLLKVPGGDNDPAHAFPGARQLRLDGPAGHLWREFLRSNPGGLVQIDPAEVLASLQVAALDRAPGYAGLAELVESGKLVVVSHGVIQTELPQNPDGSTTIAGMRTVGGTAGDSFIDEHGEQFQRGLDGVWRSQRPDELRITGPIDLPIGLNRVRALTFLLPAGVAHPHGELGHVTLIEEN